MALILIADDDRISTHLLAAAVRRGGHEVETTATVRETTDRLDRDPLPDCILLDVNMPDGTASDVLRATVGTPAESIPVLLMSASDLDLLQTLQSPERIRARLTKPIPLATVTASIAAVLS